MFNRLIEKLYKYDKIFIHSHVNPDGDSLGSSFGLYHIIKENFSKKRVYVVSEKSQRLQFLGEPDLVFPEMYEDSLSIIVDTPVEDRVSFDYFKNSEKVVVLDHHQPMGEFADVMIIDSNLPACSQLVAEFAIDANLVIVEEAATALYTGILTDTGGFRHRGITPRTHEILAKLLECGAQYEMVHDALSRTTPNFFKFKGFFYESFKVEEDVAYITIRKSDIDRFGITMEDAQELVNELGSLEGINKWVLFREEENGYKARMRSNNIRIDLLAQEYGGGGHKLASGCHVDSEEMMQEIITKLKDLK